LRAEPNSGLRISCIALQPAPKTDGTPVQNIYYSLTGIIFVIWSSHFRSCSSWWPTAPRQHAGDELERDAFRQFSAGKRVDTARRVHYPLGCPNARKHGALI